MFGYCIDNMGDSTEEDNIFTGFDNKFAEVAKYYEETKIRTKIRDILNKPQKIDKELLDNAAQLLDAINPDTLDETKTQLVTRAKESLSEANTLLETSNRASGNIMYGQYDALGTAMQELRNGLLSSSGGRKSRKSRRKRATKRRRRRTNRRGRRN